jgi:hypothetical protein
MGFYQHQHQQQHQQQQQQQLPNSQQASVSQEKKCRFVKLKLINLKTLSPLKTLETPTKQICTTLCMM